MMVIAILSFSVGEVGSSLLSNTVRSCSIEGLDEYSPCLIPSPGCPYRTAREVAHARLLGLVDVVFLRKYKLILADLMSSKASSLSSFAMQRVNSPTTPRLYSNELPGTGSEGSGPVVSFDNLP